MSDVIDRRDFLKTAALAGAGLALDGAGGAAHASPAAQVSAVPASVFSAAPPLETVRVALVGVGHQGTSHVENFLKIPGVEITAICDVMPAHAERARRMVVEAGRPEPGLGATILLTHDTNLPRPYSRKILLQGTRGIVRKYPEEKIHVEGRSAAHRWQDTADYRATFEHPIWKELEQQSRGAGHVGMDYIEDYRLIRALREGLATDMDVYDGAAWTSIIMLSERSVASRSAPQPFPDFTRGRWQTRPPLDLGEGMAG